jgi:uncharacterized protein involved in exopolysaccharide biosynthesis
MGADTVRRDARGANLSDVYRILGNDREARASPGKAGDPQAVGEWHGAAAVWSRAPKFGDWAGALDTAPARSGRRLPGPLEPLRSIRKTAWRLVALSIFLIAIAAAGAYAVSSVGERIYAARSEIAFDLRDLGWDSSERFLSTQPVIANSRAVLTPIAAAFGIPVSDLEERLSVETVGGSGVVRLQFAHSAEVVALEITRAITTRYLAELTAFDQVDPIRRWVITEAFLLDQPISPQPLRAAALGAVAGLALAAGVVLLRVLTWSPR